MSKIIVDENEYIALCNQELQEHPDFEDGMAIVGVPEGYSGSDLSGYKWKGFETKRGIFAQVTSAVDKKYECRLTQRTPSGGK